MAVPTWHVVAQTAPSAEAWSPVVAVYATTSSLPVATAWQAHSDASSARASAEAVPVTLLADVVVPLARPTDVGGAYTYAPEYVEYVSMTGTRAVPDLEVTLWWRAVTGESYALPLTAGASVDAKLVFEAKGIKNSIEN